MLFVMAVNPAGHDKKTIQRSSIVSSNHSTSNLSFDIENIQFVSQGNPKKVK